MVFISCLNYLASDSSSNSLMCAGTLAKTSSCSEMYMVNYHVKFTSQGLLFFCVVLPIPSFSGSHPFDSPFLC